MTATIQPDTRGVDALTGEMDANVAQVQPLLFDQLMAEMADQFPVNPVSGPELEFDEQPWRALPTMQELERLWLVSPAVDIIIHQLATKLHGDGPDLGRFIATQWDLAAMELRWIKERQAEDAREKASATVDRRLGEDGPVGTAAARRGGVDLSGGFENGVEVVGGGQTSGTPDTGRTPKIPRRRGAGAAARRRGTVADADTATDT